ncbi:MAG: signal peptidase II [Dehalococcoidia bacterium]|nr:signal peptidase II [Dehalococcoidia bacterium]
MNLEREDRIRLNRSLGRGVILLIAIVVIAADQLTKQWVTANLAMGQSLPEGAAVRLTYVVNTGAAFGILPQYSVYLVLVAFLVIGMVFFYQRYLPGEKLLVKSSLGLMLGGALGNLIDRLRYGFVVDFVDVRVWPVFNLADASISVGVCLLAFFLIFVQEKKEAT